MSPRISLIIPAHNEAEFLPACLEASRQAALRIDSSVEVIVVLNRCRDATEEIARRHGCLIAHEDSKNLAAIRNAGASVASGAPVQRRRQSDATSSGVCATPCSGCRGEPSSGSSSEFAP